MQYFTLIGGFIGFLLAFLVSLIAGKSLEDVVFNATIGCVLTALLFRIFRFSLEYCAKQVVNEKSRVRELEKAAATEETSTPDGTAETPTPSAS